MKLKEFVYGKHIYRYYLIREDRKTLGLTVRSDLNLVVRAPLKASTIQVNDFLKKKWLWLEKQIAYFKKFQKYLYKKEYVSGESFLYLGRQYTLKVRKNITEEVCLQKGIIQIQTLKRPSNGFHNRKLLENWYIQRMEIVLPERYKEVLKNFNYINPPILEVRKMPKRWGSFLTKKKVYLNPELIKASTDCIDYVITHELCHIVCRNHSEEFYKLLKTKIPDWEKRKEKLELRLGGSLSLNATIG